MKLYLMRHGEAQNAAENTPRSLSQKGRAEVKKMAEFLEGNHLTIAQIYHSEKLRAEQTAAEVGKRLSSAPNVKYLAGLLPHDDVKSMAVHCNYWCEDTMLVGHLPYLVNLAWEILAGNKFAFCSDFQTAAVLCLERDIISSWRIEWFMPPALIVLQ